MAAQFWLQVFFPLCIQSYSTYSSLSLLCAFVAEKRERHMKELHQHFHVGHNMINKNPIISRFCIKKRDWCEPVCTSKKECLHGSMWLCDLLNDPMGLTVILILKHILIWNH